MKGLNVRYWRLIVLAGSIGIIVWRAPSLFLEPRLWAEEGTLYFAYAYHFANTPEWLNGLINIQLGYFSLWPNIASTVAANLFSLEQVPFVTTALALTVQLMAIAVILWGESKFWQTPIQKTICVLVVIFVPLSGEIWLNTINSQFVFGLIAFLILHSNADVRKPIKWWYRVLLLFSGLTGVVSCFLTPLFILRALAEKSRERAIQMGILVICVSVQATIQLLSLKDLVSARGAGIEWQTLAAILWTQSIGLTIFGLKNALRFSALIVSADAHGSLEFTLISIIILSVEMMFIIILFICSTPKLSDRMTLIGSYLILIILSILGSLGTDKFEYVLPGYGQRYFYAPNIILMLIVAVSIQISTNLSGLKRQWRSILLAMLLASSLCWGVSQYGSTTIAGADWPKWQEQVQMWRENPARPIQIWPPGWQMQLTK